MDRKRMLGAIRDDNIEFVTLRPPGSRFASLERRIAVTGPPELVELLQTPDLVVLDALVELLREPERSWAAVIMLAALTRREEEIVNAFAQSPAEWRNSLGKKAYERWFQWLEGARKTLRWNPEQEAFVEVPNP